MSPTPLRDCWPRHAAVLIRDARPQTALAALLLSGRRAVDLTTTLTALSGPLVFAPVLLRLLRAKLLCMSRTPRGTFVRHLGGVVDIALVLKVPLVQKTALLHKVQHHLPGIEDLLLGMQVHLATLRDARRPTVRSLAPVAPHSPRNPVVVHNHVLVASPFAGPLFDPLEAPSQLHDLRVLELGLGNLLVTLGLLHPLGLLLRCCGLRCRRGAVMAFTQVQEVCRLFSVACRVLATIRASIFSRLPVVVLEALVG